jgi:hypothetical protein
MSVYTPHLAPIVVLAFLGSAFLLIMSLFVSVVAALRRARRVASASLRLGMAIALAYVAVLLTFSFFSRDATIVPGAWKYFCEIDCHIAYSICDAQSISADAGELQINGPSQKFVIVQLRTWFDRSTISAHRGDGPLTPSERKVRLIDGRGREFVESPQAAWILQAKGLHSTPLRTPLRPGESYISYLVFETPGGVSDYRLLLTSAEELDAAIWGHEASPFHGKAYFSIRS